ncbi:hypothetical protein WICPIJ_005592 [Wickerhamomyces pijperi]|uniref:GABA-specific permease n=1 Tax=Wickerhamomyces pijperi TaxID=599730 RepID=A0A9P8TLU0_WICPI|nr:hypothetical protein WICPIJ_005592 [Wickerhamomyces pijperi]
MSEPQLTTKLSARLSNEQLHNLRSVRSVTSKTGAGTVPDVNALTAHNAEELLAEIGYKQELKRTMSGLGCFGIAFSIMGLLPSIITLMGLGLSGTGPVSLLWGWFIAGFLILICIGVPMAETASSLPTSGGLYYWTNYYAPPSLKIPLSFFIGIANTFALAGGVCSISYGFANQILSAIYISKDGDFDITAGKTYGVLVAAISVELLICCLSSKNTSRLQTTSIVANNLLIVIFFIALPIGTARTVGFNDAKFIFGNAENLSEWTPGWAFFQFGFMPACWTIGAFDSCVHMSEEVKDPVRNVPIGILGSISACWILGFLIMIVINACIGPDIAAVVGSPSGQPLAQMFYNSLGKEWAIAFISLAAFCQFLMASSVVTAVSRQAWAFARDEGLPFSRYFKVVNEALAVPVRALFFVCGLSMLISLLVLIGAEGANALFSVAIIGNYVAWMTPQILRITSGRDVFRPGAFYLGKFLSPAMVVLGSFFMSFVIVIACMPTDTTVDKTTMNYSIVLNAGSWIFSFAYYYAYKKGRYVGPKSNLTDAEYVDAVEGDILNIDDVLAAKEDTSSV